VTEELIRLLGKENVLVEREDLIPYSFDGTAAMRRIPEVVVFPRTRGGV
jgi:glycolate oxidase